MPLLKNMKNINQMMNLSYGAKQTKRKNMYYVVEIINYKYSSPSHNLVFNNENLDEVMEYKLLKTKLNKIEDENNGSIKYVILAPRIDKKVV